MLKAAGPVERLKFSKVSSAFVKLKRRSVLGSQCLLFKISDSPPGNFFNKTPSLKIPREPRTNLGKREEANLYLSAPALTSGEC